MVNVNGSMMANNEAVISVFNRGFNYGDSVFETLKVSYDKILFLEDHYFRLMASMRILRMEIPMNFTLEYIEDQIMQTVHAQHSSNNAHRVKIVVFRDSKGLYLPNNNNIGFIITSSILNQSNYNLSTNPYTIDIYKDHFVAADLLSTLKSNNRIINTIGSIYAKENNLNNCLLLNTEKHVIEALNGNLFVVNKNIIKTPPLNDGCIKGVMRKQLIDIINAMSNYEIEEGSISTFELQKADEIFVTNVILGIQPVSSYRKKTYTCNVSKILIEKLNLRLRLS
ncbi:aminotransferase class IV [Flavobacteriaceae bacterium]|nr:aminotransferase class IV [Flavobacteriaceae bacterium]